jgi:carbon monoxide dehydrogenase subunit G
MMIIAEKTFRVAGSQEKIWEFLTKALLRSIPFEQVEFTDERGFSALLRLKIGYLTLPTKVTVAISNMVEPETFAAKISLSGMGGIIQLDQVARFDVKGSDKAPTEVAAKLEAERMSPLLHTFLLWKVKNFARDFLNNVERLLKDWVL